MENYRKLLVFLGSISTLGLTACTASFGVESRLFYPKRVGLVFPLAYTPPGQRPQLVLLVQLAGTRLKTPQSLSQFEPLIVYELEYPWRSASGSAAEGPQPRAREREIEGWGSRDR